MIKRGYIEIMNRCNWHCPFCPQSNGLSDPMPVETFEAIIKLLKGKCEEVTLHLLGEPLLHPKIDQLLDILQTEKMALFLVTNGVYLNEKILKLSILKQINISLHGLPFQKINQESYLSNLVAFCRQALSTRPELYLNLRLWNLKNERFNEKVRTLLENVFEIKINPKTEVKLNKGKKLIGRLYLHHDTQFSWPTLNSAIIREDEIYCHALSHQIAIRSNGEVTACCLDYNGVNSLGDFREVLPNLSSYTSEEFRMKLFNGSKLCKRCSYSKERCKKRK